MRESIREEHTVPSLSSLEIEGKGIRQENLPGRTQNQPSLHIKKGRNNLSQLVITQGREEGWKRGDHK